MNYCPGCGGGLVLRVPPQDTRERHLCDACGVIHYQNPRVIVGAVATWGERILLCKRAIEPRRGKWTLPAGFLELGETTRQGALREAREEANAELELGGVLALYDLDTIGQVQVFYAARLVHPEVSPGVESLEVGLFAWDELPWDELAFPTVHWALRYHREVRELEVFPPDTGAKSSRT